MNRNTESLSATVVGGAGHVGAPLAIVLAAKGIPTVIHDINEGAMAELAAGRLPFLEDGGEALLSEVLPTKRLTFSTDPACVEKTPVVIVTIGTPIDEFHNPVLSVLARCVDRLLPHITDSHTLILRSTVAPGATAYLKRYLEARGRRPAIAFCPERVVQGKAIEEIQTLPQIVSGTEPRAVEVAKRVFSRIAPSVVEMSVQEAEFAKLICNAYRYIQFAATNQLYMLVESAGLDYNGLLAKMRDGYPRLAGIPGPGFAAGPCLMKDTMQLSAFGKERFLLGQAAVTVNEGLPNFIVERLRDSGDISGKHIGILGMAFKAESDDTRDSLSFKLRKLLEFHGARVLCSDEYVQGDEFVTKEKLLQEAEIVIIGVPHSAYRGCRARPGAQVIDLWESGVEQARSERSRSEDAQDGALRANAPAPV